MVSAEGYANVARQHLTAGYSPLPVPRGQKTPVPKGWTGAGAPMASGADVEAWSEDRPGDNIAARLPDNVIGIDVDAYDGRGGAETLTRGEADLGALPAAPSVTSRGPNQPSRIRLYRVPAGSGDRLVSDLAKLYGANIDVIRHGHRYCMAPGSTHPEGRTYQAYAADGAPLPEGHMPAVADLPDLPEKWVTGLTQPERPERPATGGDTALYDALSDDDRGRADRYVTRVRKDETDRLKACQDAATPNGVGYRGNPWQSTVYEVSCNLMEVANSPWNAYTEREARADVLADAPADHGFGDREVLAAIESARKTVAGKSRPFPFEVGAGEAAPSDGGTEAKFDGAGEGMADAMLCAQVARDVMAGRFRWARGLNWLSWTGRRWKPVPEQVVHEATRHYLLTQWRGAVKRLAKGRDSEERKMLSSVVTAWQATLNKGRITSITSLTQGIGGIFTDAADLDGHPDLLNCGNGVVDLRTGDLGPHDPDLLLTKMTTVDYHPGAHHADWDAALGAVPVDVLNWVQVRYGQAATGYMTPDDVMVVQDGGGENGKTTLVGGVRGALGDYYVMISHRALLGDPSQHPTELMSFRGARLALLEELPEERRMNVTRLKAVVGTPYMKARLIRHDEVEFAATHSLFLNTNHLPVVDETDHGTWRRLARLRFPWRYLKQDETATGPFDRPGDPRLRQRVEEGRHGQHEAALAWLVAGAGTWYANDRSMPPAPPRVVADTKAWRGKSDLLMGYAEERLIFDLDAHVLGTELLADFNDWLKVHGHREWSDRTLAGRLEEHSEFIAQRVEKRAIRANPRLSRRYTTHQTPPATYKAWLGVRFRQPSDGWGDIDNALTSNVSAVSAAPVNSLEKPLARFNQTSRNSRNKDQSRELFDDVPPAGAPWSGGVSEQAPTTPLQSEQPTSRSSPGGSAPTAPVGPAVAGWSA